MKKVLVSLGDRSYPIIVGSGLLERAGTVLAGMGFARPPVVISNRRVLHLHGDRILASLGEAFGPAKVLRIGDGERFKDQATLNRIYEGLFRAHADRRSWILALGGGVVGDIAGFAAATYMRGIPYVQVPTTLLAQVDSSVGGKVGINTARGKNLLGAFCQPRAVLADTDVLKTLPRRELASGLYEVVKCGAIRSVSLLHFLNRKLPEILRLEPRALTRVIIEAVSIKARVVSVDEREAGGRMVLNFGHTVGHALEAATEYRRFKHGEAVAWGMIAAAGFAENGVGLTADERARLTGLIHRIEPLPPLRGIPAARVWRAIRLDKKNQGETMRMVLLPNLGATRILEVSDWERLRRYLAGFLERRGDAGQGP